MAIDIEEKKSILERFNEWREKNVKLKRLV